MGIDENYFEGTVVLERLAELGKVEDFFEAVDGDNFGKVQSLLQQAKINSTTILAVLEKMREADGEH